MPCRCGSAASAGSTASPRISTAEGVDLLVDATHPFADQMSRNAVAASIEAGVPLLALRRPAWTAAWRATAGPRSTASRRRRRRLGGAPRRVFLALGRQEIDGFAPAPQHFYLVRSIDPIADGRFLATRSMSRRAGRSARRTSVRLMAAHASTRVVARNSGGEAGYAKIAAARALGIEVDPDPAARRCRRRPTVATVDEAMAWIDHRGASAADRGV